MEGHAYEKLHNLIGSVICIRTALHISQTCAWFPQLLVALISIIALILCINPVPISEILSGQWNSNLVASHRDNYTLPAVTPDSGLRSLSITTCNSMFSR